MDISKLANQLKFFSGKSNEQQMAAYGDNLQSTALKSSNVCFESSGIFGLSPNTNIN